MVYSKLTTKRRNQYFNTFLPSSLLPLTVAGLCHQLTNALVERKQVRLLILTLVEWSTEITNNFLTPQTTVSVDVGSGWVSLLDTLKVQTELRRFPLVLIDIKSIGFKFRFLSAHLGERERKRESNTPPPQLVKVMTSWKQCGETRATQPGWTIWAACVHRGTSCFSFRRP